MTYRHDIVQLISNTYSRLRLSVRCRCEVHFVLVIKYIRNKIGTPRPFSEQKYFIFRKNGNGRDVTIEENTVSAQSEHIGQWATPHDRRLGGINRVVPIGFLFFTSM